MQLKDVSLTTDIVLPDQIEDIQNKEFVKLGLGSNLSNANESVVISTNIGVAIGTNTNSDLSTRNPVNGYIFQRSVAIGANSTATGMCDDGTIQGVAIGYDSQVDAASGIAIGPHAKAKSRTHSDSCQLGIAIGYNSFVNGNGAIAIGSGAGSGGDIDSPSSNGIYSISIGRKSVSTEENSIAIGQLSKSLAKNSVQLGEGTNNLSGTLNFLSTQIVDQNGKVPLNSIQCGQYDGYIPYIKFTGEQYYDTKISVTYEDTYDIDFQIDTNSQVSTMGLFGCRYNNTVKSFQMFYANETKYHPKQISFDYCVSGYNRLVLSDMIDDVGSRLRFKISSVVEYNTDPQTSATSSYSDIYANITNVTENKTSSFHILPSDLKKVNDVVLCSDSDETWKNTTYPCYLGKINQISGANFLNFVGKLYGFSISGKDGTKKIDLVPVYKDGVASLYDKVSKTILSCQTYTTDCEFQDFNRINIENRLKSLEMRLKELEESTQTT